MSKKYCLLLGIEKSRDRALLAAARSTNMKIAIMYPNGTINNHRFSDITLCGDPNRSESVLESVKEYEKKTGYTPSHVIPLTEMSILPAAKISEQYDLPYLDSQTVKNIRDKHTMKECFNHFELPIARHKTFTNDEDITEAIIDLNFPLVIKPRNAGGSEGVIFVENKHELQEAYTHLNSVAQVNENRYGLATALYQVEEFIVAPYEISVEVINSPNGRAVCTMTDKYLTGLPFFVEMGHSIPSKWIENQEIKDIAIRACEALSLDRGIAHVELKVDKNGKATVIEVNARPAGDCIMDLAEKVTGINLFELHIQSYIDPDFTPPADFPQNGRASIAFLNADEGKVSQVDTPQPSDLPSFVTALNIYTKVGNTSQACFDSNGRDGAVEFYWSDGLPDENFHLKFAQQLSKNIFQ